MAAQGKHIDSPPTGDLTEWFADHYRQAVNLSSAEGSLRFRRLASELPVLDKKGEQLASGRNRINRFLQLKMRFALAHDGYSCRAYYARLRVAGAPDTFVCYAFAFWPAQRDQSVDYVCVAPTFDSRDGEFRQRFIPAAAFVKGCDLYSESTRAAEDLIGVLLADGRLELRATDFGSTPPGPATFTRVLGDRLSVAALAVALTLDAWNSIRSLLAAHIHADYLRFVSKVIELEPVITLRSRDLDPQRWIFERGVLTSNTTACGVKLVPMFAREVQQPFDVNLGAWRELEISQAVGDLVVQFVSPSFAMYNQWSFIEHTGPTLYENAAMHERYARSQRLQTVVKRLRESRRALSELERQELAALTPSFGDRVAPNARVDGTSDSAEVPNARDPGAEQRNCSGDLKNYHTEELSSHIYETLDYAQSHLMMSDTTLMHTIEDVGRTLYAWPAYVRRAADPVPAVARLFASEGSAARVLFEYAYGAHCLHSLTGVAHGDLHSNNLTVFEWGRVERPDAAAPPRADGARTFYSLYEDPVVLYVAGPAGEADAFLFPADGISGALIDYSRAIVGPAFRPRIEGDRGAQYATNFYRDQVNRAVRTLHRYAPEYVAAHQDAIKGAAFADFESVFAVLCAVDFIAIGASVAAVLAAAAAEADPLELRAFRAAPAAAELARALEVAGRAALIAGLHGIVAAVKRRKTGGASGGASGGSSGSSSGSAACPYCDEAGAAAPACAECNSLATITIAQAQAQDAQAQTHGGAAAKDDAPAFPGAKIIAQVFKKYRFAEAIQRHPRPQLIDAYNYNNYDAAVSSTDYARWPRWARVDEIEKHLGEYKMTDLFDKGVEPFLESLSGYEIPFEVLAAQERADAEAADGKPTAAASSWIDD